MYTVEFRDANNGVRERITLGRLANAIEADRKAKALFPDIRAQYPEVVSYFIFENGLGVAGFRKACGEGRRVGGEFISAGPGAALFRRLFRRR